MKLSVQHLDLTILKTDQAFRFPETRSGVKNREAVSRRGDSQLEHRTAVKDTIPLLIILPQELHVFRKSSAFRPVNHDLVHQFSGSIGKTLFGAIRFRIRGREKDVDVNALREKAQRQKN